jgi:NADPH:quinone reductase-like Zn-dependent oxidoreductase
MPSTTRHRTLWREVQRITNGRGVDVVLDMVAGDYVAREVECLAEDGRLVIIAVQGGVKSAFNAGLVLRRRLTITGSTLRPRSVEFKGPPLRSLSVPRSGRSLSRVRFVLSSTAPLMRVMLRLLMH